MQKEECYYLGRITKPFGLRGQMALFLDVDDPAAYSQLDTALVDMKEGLVPYLFHIDQLNDRRAIVTFEDISKAEALALAGHDLYLPLSMLPKLTGNHFYFHEVKGFRVIDEEKGEIGILQTVIEFPAHPLLQIMKNETEILIPIIPQVIKRVDRAEKTLYITAPNGLIDLYLKSN